MIDADRKEVVERMRELDEELRSRELDPRDEAEAIALLIPKRNIETWIWNLRGEDVDESQSYPKLARQSECQDAVDELLETLSSQNTTNVLCESLLHGCQELERLPI